jgi:murein DD-endopeptidase MepM/ murein hydrolase activator NlpD
MKFTTQPVKYPKLRTAKLASVKGATFGMVRNGGARAHQGLDLAVSVGFRCYAVENGTVVSTGDQPTGHGLFVAIRLECPHKPQLHGLIAFYSHLSRIDVKQGDTLTAGAQIGLSGATGNAKSMTTIETGSHLHFELRTILNAGLGLQNRIDPLPFIELI